MSLSVDERDELRSTARSLLAASRRRRVSARPSANRAGLRPRAVGPDGRARMDDDPRACRITAAPAAATPISRSCSTSSGAPSTPSPFLAERGARDRRAGPLRQRRSLRSELLAALTQRAIAGLGRVREHRRLVRPRTCSTTAWDRTPARRTTPGSGGLRARRRRRRRARRRGASIGRGHRWSSAVDRAMPGVRVEQAATVDATRRLFTRHLRRRVGRRRSHAVRAGRGRGGAVRPDALPSA